ncbi:MAG TPA: YdcF family protein [Vicinamibacterales bacterium]|nr:YdcF family protein [Vicinamibacterales bacterium]
MKRFLRRSAIVLAPLLLISVFLLRSLGSWLVVQDPLAHADAIVVLGGTMYERQMEAVDLYKEGWAPRIFVLREIADWGEAELIARGIPYTRVVDMQVETMEKLGVPKDHITILDPANSTAEEAQIVLRLATDAKLTRLIIVTSKQHTRRARLVMNRRLQPAGVNVVVRASRYDRTDTAAWWRNRSTLRFTMFETQRLFGYWIGVAD